MAEPIEFHCLERQDFDLLALAHGAYLRIAGTKASVTRWLARPVRSFALMLLYRAKPDRLETEQST